MYSMTYFFFGDLEGHTNRLAHNIMVLLVDFIMLQARQLDRVLVAKDDTSFQAKKRHFIITKCSHMK